MNRYNPLVIKKYQKKYEQRIANYTIFFQAINLIFLGLILNFFTPITASSPYFWMLILTFLAISSVFMSYILTEITNPQKQLIQAISRISSGDATITSIIELEKHQASGFSEVLKLLSGNQSKTKNSSKISTSELPEIINQADVGVIIFDKNNQVKWKNQSAPILGNLSFKNQKSLQEWLEKSCRNKLRSSHSWQRIPARNLDGSDKIYDIQAFFSQANSGESVVFFIDKTKKYAVDEEDLNFIAFAAHELRGPITIIRGYLDILNTELANQLSLEQKELFSRLIVSSNRLSSYINNILNVSKFDNNRMKFNLDETSVDSLVDSVKDDLILRATAQNRLLKINLPKNLPNIAADNSSASEVIINLVDNAIKYSHEGGVIILSAKQDGDFIDISVQDNGIGIPPIALENLFKKFYRSHRSRETVAGTGIGLYISRAIIEGHGGKITVKSREGEGSTFTISLPIFEKVKHKLEENDSNFIRQPGGGWIRNHGKVRG